MLIRCNYHHFQPPPSVAPTKAASGQSGMTMERQLQQLHLEQQQFPGYQNFREISPKIGG